LQYRLKLGENYLYLESYDAARKEFDFVLKENPKIAGAWNDAGFLDLLEHKSEPAFQKFTKAVELNPDYIPARLNLAKVWSIRGDSNKAISIVNDILEKEPGNKDAQQLLSFLQAH
jgi:predicted Zn-dependent protease